MMYHVHTGEAVVTSQKIEFFDCHHEAHCALRTLFSEEVELLKCCSTHFHPF